jgi:hypothetical protein
VWFYVAKNKFNKQICVFVSMTHNISWVLSLHRRSNITTSFFTNWEFFVLFCAVVFLTARGSLSKKHSAFYLLALIGRHLSDFRVFDHFFLTSLTALHEWNALVFRFPSEIGKASREGSLFSVLCPLPHCHEHQAFIPNIPLLLRADSVSRFNS